MNMNYLLLYQYIAHGLLSIVLMDYDTAFVCHLWNAIMSYDEMFHYMMILTLSLYDDTSLLYDDSLSFYDGICYYMMIIFHGMTMNCHYIMILCHYMMILYK